MMESPLHTMNALFSQLGLPSSDEDIESFIQRHRPLAKEIPLDEALVWNDNQARFLREAIDDDADWAELVDQLDARLRH